MNGNANTEERKSRVQELADRGVDAIAFQASVESRSGNRRAEASGHVLRHGDRMETFYKGADGKPHMEIDKAQPHRSTSSLCQQKQRKIIRKLASQMDRVAKTTEQMIAACRYRREASEYWRGSGGSGAMGDDVPLVAAARTFWKPLRVAHPLCIAVVA